MNNHPCECHKRKTAKCGPASPKYAENVKNHAHNKSPYGEDEPSTHTSYK